MNRRHFLHLSASTAALSAVPRRSRAEEGAAAVWDQFRGPQGNGHSPATGLPVEWSESTNVAWKAAVPHKGWSTPLVLGAQVWLTTATDDGRDYFVLCYDRETGRILHEARLFHSDSPEPLGNDLNSYASPTGFLEEGRFYAHFGSYGTACIDTTTFREIWRRTDLPCRHYRGPGSSLFPWKNTIILTMDGVDVQYLAALDRESGKTVWKTDRNTDWNDLDPSGKPLAEGDYRKAYSTPILIRPGGVPQLVSTGSKATVAYDPDTGRELWRVRYDGFSNASLPAWHDGLVIVNTGHSKAMLRAYRVEAGTSGDITDQIVWEQTKYVPTRSSPVIVGDLYYMMADNGFISAVDLKSGEVLYSERSGGSCSASPLAADGRIYFCNERGDTQVIAPGREYRLLARNSLDSGILASPAAAGRELYIRTRTSLYRIQEGA